jgi:DNA (cytosine-5)-methyltransferase 1
MKIKAVSLFCGCGGLDWGFHRAGVEIVKAVDNDPAAIQCYNHNLGGGGVCLSVEDPAFPKMLEEVGDIDIVLGGFPCQGFSKSGPKKKDDPRNKLYGSMLFAIERLKPLVFVAENVDGLAQNYQGELLTKIFSDFSALGYAVEYKIIDAADFGVPQHRRRIFFIGTRASQRVSWPSPTHLAKVRNGEFLSKDLLKPDYGLFAPELEPVLTMRDGIGDLLDPRTPVADHVTVNEIKPNELAIIRHIREGQKLCNVRFAGTSVYTWQVPEVFGKVTAREVTILETIARNRRKKVYGDIPNGNPLPVEEIACLSGLDVQTSEIEALKKKGYVKEMEGKYDLRGAMFCSGLYKRPSWDEPSPTIITLFHSPRYFVHPSEDRPFSIRECARLQSFPDGFHFLASGISIEDSYRLIGNAVAPKLAFEIARIVLNLIKPEKKHEIKPVVSGQRDLVEGI